MDNAIVDKLERARKDLLDLSGRNCLVNTPRSSSRSGRLEIDDELSQEVYRHLVREKKAMSFLPIRGSDEDASSDELDDDTIHLLQPEEDDDVDENGIAARHTDDRLQTRLTSESLQRKLLKLHYDARTYEEEQGVNILYLALGFLKWFEADASDRERFAPLILVPVTLERRSATSRFKLAWSEDDIATNLSLREKLKLEFGIESPEVPDVDDFSPNEYYTKVSEAISDQQRWEVLPNDMVLWFFSFSKFLMYRDLHPDSWPAERAVEKHGLVEALLKGGFGNDPPICADDDQIDRFLQPLDMVHVMDADSSQTLAIEEVKRGRSLVVQGPPGTGKSQTITNLIAAAVKDGKTILFVAEKMAALEVVKRRLDNIGLGDMCLELHSHKASKRHVLDDLAHTLNLGKPKTENIAAQAQELTAYRDKLNRHAEVLHTYLEPARQTPYQVLGELVRLRAAGVQQPDFKLLNPVSWSAAQFREKLNLLRDLSTHLEQIGNPAEHVWRGVQLPAVLPSDIDRMSRSLPGISARIERVIVATKELAELLSFGPARTPLDVVTLANFARMLITAPPMDRTAIADEVWKSCRDEIDVLVEEGKRLTECRAKLSNVVADLGWETDVAAARRDIAAYGRSLFRFFNKKYRQAQATLQGILVGDLPTSREERIDILDTLMRGQKAYRSVCQDPRLQEIGRRAFGSRWRDADSDWAALEKICNWDRECRQATIPENFRHVRAQLDDAEVAKPYVLQIKEDLKPMMSEVGELFKSLKCEPREAFGIADLRALPLETLKSRLEEWQSNEEALTKWISYHQRWKKLEAEGMGDLGRHLDEGLIEPQNAIERFQMAYYDSLMREAFRKYPELAEFNGVSHEQALAKFRDLDMQRLTLARQEIATAHFQGLPLGGGDAGEVGVVRREIKKKRRHLPIRKLLSQAGHAIQAIKPVMMMSPISVAQYLEPGVLEFDLLLVDEASQVQPVDALGAIARAKQVVVVGDDKQLPPTSFFNKILGDDGEADDAEDFQTGDLESILGLCIAQNMPQRMLQWHYRSRHHSLIAVSNHEFYDDRLFVVPSPMNGHAGLGLAFTHIREGIFDRGKSRTNRIEAQAVADRVLQHARECPDKKLGVGTFSVAQRDAILDELELRRRDHPELETFFAEGRREPFFVKNLENIQGDERDVILISVGYAKDDSGYMAMSFGPLSNEGGERRLNVLITRARERCEVFSSIVADDIDLNRAKSRGAKALKTFFTYAQSGFLDVAEATNREYDSEFEREVAKAIINRGYDVEPQVGVAGFFIDLAVVDPDVPGRYLLGIECDGAAYHSSRSARDRDRLRQQVLEAREWIIHRIWSTDWFHRPDEQLHKVLAAIENAKIDWSRKDAGEQPEQDEPAVVHQPEEIARHDAADHHEECNSSSDGIPYQEASFGVDTHYEIHELSSEQLATVVTRIVQVEGPIHQDEITRRVTSLWGLKRAGARITDAVDAALSTSVHYGKVEQDGLFYTPVGQKEVPIRNRENVASKNLRKPDYLPPVEIRAAVCAVAKKHFGVTKDDAIVETSRLLGFKSTSGQLRDLISQEIDFLVVRDQLSHRNNRLYVAKDAAGVG